ncbi:MAG: DUF5119 domain-containing protein, partial [Paramuribaculum sp.]|nr:DUF5119 domain-containing protein [Paramuribaculum sp.]
MREIAFTTVLTAIWALITGCSHKDIYDLGETTSRIDISIEWDRAPAASPAGMTLYFFPTSKNGKIWRFDIAGPNGGEVEIPTGYYQMIAVNNDLPSVKISDASSFMGFTEEALGTDDALQPAGMLYGGVIDYLEVTPCGVVYHTGEGTIKECRLGLVRCHPDSLTTIFNVIVRNIKGFERLASAKASVSGVGRGIHIGDEESIVNSGKYTVELALGKKGDQKSLAGSAGAFADTEIGNYSLRLLLTLKDGKKTAKTFDVSSQVVNSVYSRNVTILIDSLEIPSGDIPEPPGGDVGGIEVGVDGWENIEIDLTT